MVICLAQGHNAVTPVRFKSATPWSQVKHSATPPPTSFYKNFDKQPLKIQNGQFHMYCINIYMG